MNEHGDYMDEVWNKIGMHFRLQVIQIHFVTMIPTGYFSVVNEY